MIPNPCYLLIREKVKNEEEKPKSAAHVDDVLNLYFGDIILRWWSHRFYVYQFLFIGIKVEIESLDIDKYFTSTKWMRVIPSANTLVWFINELNFSDRKYHQKKILFLDSHSRTNDFPITHIYTTLHSKLYDKSRIHFVNCLLVHRIKRLIAVDKAGTVTQWNDKTLYPS